MAANAILVWSQSQFFEKIFTIKYDRAKSAKSTKRVDSSQVTIHSDLFNKMTLQLIKY